MNDITRLVERYVALWNEADENLRRRGIAEIWSEGASHFTPSVEAHGHDALERRIRSAHERFVGGGEYVFALINNVDAHHGTVKFNWAMRPAKGGDVVSVGFDFLMLDSDGRIQADYQFIEP
jgi:hypothetical protein